MNFLTGAVADAGKISISSKVWKTGYNLPSSPVLPVLSCSELSRAAAAPEGGMSKVQGTCEHSVSSALLLQPLWPEIRDEETI